MAFKAYGGPRSSGGGGRGRGCAVVLLAGLVSAFIAAGVWAASRPEPETPATVAVDTPTTTTTSTTTTVPPTTTTTSSTTTTVPPTTTVRPTTTTTAPPPPPPTTAAPPPPSPETVGQVYARCSRGYATSVTVVPGSTSRTGWDRSVMISEYHMYRAGAAKRCWVMAHEDGHAYAMTVAPDTAIPPGWPHGIERWADCYAQLVVGGQYGTCPDLGLAQALT